MKVPTHFGQLLTIALAASPLASAVPWPEWLPDVDALVVRQDGGSTTAAPASTTQAQQTNLNTASRAQTTNLNTGGQSRTATGSAASGTASGSGSGTVTGSAEATRSTFNPQDPAGGVSMITPAASLGTQLYKIGDKVTFAWNYTSLQASPTAVNVLASCSTASNIWTISANMSFSPTQTVTWDTGAYQQTAVASPLLTEEYTLIIYDAESAITATAEAGYLATYDRFTFGIYEGKPYKDLGEWKCATCSGAASLGSKALGMAVGMCLITILSFTWFVTGTLL